MLRLCHITGEVERRLARSMRQRLPPMLTSTPIGKVIPPSPFAASGKGNYVDLDQRGSRQEQLYKYQLVSIVAMTRSFGFGM